VVEIVWPQNTAPGNKPQDGAGRLINCYAEPRMNGQGHVWRRAPGATVFTTIHPTTASMTGTGTATFVGVNPQGVLAATGTGTAVFVGSSV
jgi:hypothetical protein